MKFGEVKEKLYDSVGKNKYKVDNALEMLDPNKEYDLIICEERDKYVGRIKTLLARSEYLFTDLFVYAGTVSTLDLNSMTGDFIFIRVSCVQRDAEDKDILCVYIGGLI